MRHYVTLLLLALCLGQVIATPAPPLLEPPGYFAADDNDDRPPSPSPVRPGRDDEPAPRSGVLARISSQLRIGQIWTVQQGTRIVSLRASIEHQGRTVAALTLEPTSGRPLELGLRVTVPSTKLYSNAELREILARLRSSSGQSLRLGQFAAASERGARVQVYWNDALSAYVYVNALSSDVLPDAAVVAELRASQQIQR